MPTTFGDIDPLAFRLGDAEVLKMYFGDVLAWQPDSGVTIDAYGPGSYQEFSSTYGGSSPPGQLITPYNHGGDEPSMVIGCISGYRTSSLTMQFYMEYGGVAMTPIGATQWGNDSSGSNSSFFQWFGLTDPPAGTQEVRGYWYGSSWASPFINVQTVSFNGAGSWLGAYSAGGTESGEALSQSIPSAEGELVLQAFMYEGLSSTSTPYPGSYDGTLIRYLDGGYAKGILGRKPGDSTVTFTATRASGADYLESAIRIVPEP